MVDRRRRIVVFGPGLAERGGMANRARLIVGELVRRGWDVRYIGRAGTTSRPRLHRDGSLVGLDIPGAGHRVAGAIVYLAVAVPLGMVWTRRAVGIFSVQLSAPFTAGAVCATFRPHLSLVATTTSSGPFGEVAYVERSRTAWLRRRLFRRATALVAQLPEVAVELERLVPASAVHIVPTPVEIPEAPTPLDGAPRVAFAGRLSEEKDLLTLVAAWRRVLAARPDARLTLYGDAGGFRSVEPQLRALIESEAALAASVVLPGWVADVRRALREHDVFVLPSLSEGMSNALLEACSEGRVVVASAIPGNVRVLGSDYLLLFPAGDEEALADVLLKALGDEGTRTASRSAVLARLSRFALPSVVARLEELVVAGSQEQRDV